MQFDLVFEGGGAKGAVFIGALQEFESRGHTARRFVGTSAGAITATLLAAGADSGWLYRELSKKDAEGRSVFASFADVPSSFEERQVRDSAIAAMLERVDLPFVADRLESALDKVVLDGLVSFKGFRVLFSLLERGGVYEGTAFVGWITSQLDELGTRLDPAALRAAGLGSAGLGSATMKQFFEIVGADLSILASDIDGQELLVFNARTTPDLPVSWAVRMSMSIPLVWQEVKWLDAWGTYRGKDITEHTIVDGGVLSNFPLDLITSGLAEIVEIMGETDPMAVPNLGFLIDEDQEVDGVETLPSEPDGLVETITSSQMVLRISKLMDTMMSARDKLVIERCLQSFEVCRLPAKGYTATEFEMSADRMQALVAAGRSAARAYFDGRAAAEVAAAAGTAGPTLPGSARPSPMPPKPVPSASTAHRPALPPRSEPAPVPYSPAPARPAPPLGLYEWLGVVGGLLYLSLPLFVLFPSLFPFLTRVPALEGARLANFSSLMAVVSPIGFIYLFAVWQRFTSLTDLTILWRLLWVGPWLLASWATGALEVTGALFIASLDVGLPVVALALSPKARQMPGRLRAHWSTFSPSIAQRLVRLEATFGFLAVFLSSAWLLFSPTAGYVEAFVLSVAGCYYLYLAWAGREERLAAAMFALGVRAALICALAFAMSVGYQTAFTANFVAALGLGLFTHGYAIVWERAAAAGWSATRWVTTGAIALATFSIFWAMGAPGYGPTCSVLAASIHRQDLIIGVFAVLLAQMLAQISRAAPLHARISSWLIPFAAVWFTSETKLLCHLGVGSPFHPSWLARGLAPKWGGSPAVDFTFSAATLSLTALAVPYTVVMLLMLYPSVGWQRLPRSGVAIILTSALWMIASSSGLPAPVESMDLLATIHAPFPVDPVRAVSLHIGDLLLGISLIGGGLLLHRTMPDSRRAVLPILVISWAVLVLPKLALYFTTFSR
ncbi:MAG: patatin-like phospholipase family protein [Pseudomonadota bacterium]|nr:patatin-like phospholipase family protein [Pseudomonadota bacterium]